MQLAGLIALFVLLPVVLWLSSVGNVLDYLAEGVPDGQLLYILSKLSGLIAISLLTLQIGLMSLRRLPRRGGLRAGLWFQWTVSRHALLGTLTIICAAVHVGLFLLATSVRADHWTWHLLLPRFQSGFYDAMVSLGALALYAALVLGVLGWAARRNRSFRPAHQLVVSLCTALIIIHSYAIGSETHTLAVKIYYATLLSILIASAFSLVRVQARQRHA